MVLSFGCLVFCGFLKSILKYKSDLINRMNISIVGHERLKVVVRHAERNDSAKN